MKHINKGSVEWYALKSNQIKSVISEIRQIEMQIDMQNGQFLKKPRYRILMAILMSPATSILASKKIKRLFQ